jgi:cadmium resistance protein CadD (predicted permease)
LLGRRPEKNQTESSGRDYVGKERLRFAWARSGAVLVTLLTLANGGDNLSVYIPLFSVQRSSMPLYALVFTMMTGLWCLLGYQLTTHRLWGEKLKRYGRFVIPFVLIAIGLNVLREQQNAG